MEYVEASVGPVEVPQPRKLGERSCVREEKVCREPPQKCKSIRVGLWMPEMEVERRAPLGLGREKDWVVVIMTVDSARR